MGYFSYLCVTKQSNMSDSKIKYLKVLKDQYNKGYIGRSQYRRELREVRGQKSFIDMIFKYFGLI